MNVKSRKKREEKKPTTTTTTTLVQNGKGVKWEAGDGNGGVVKRKRKS